MMSNPTEGEDWWKSAVIYQIYPASFNDSDGDGFGDLRGIVQKLDYLTWLGVDAIWLSPIFQSPMFDMGYDVSEYLAIHPSFGNLEDFKELVSEAHKRKIRIILDLVLNHTSIEHPWFQESRLSENNPKRDWYIWRNGPTLRKPNNWKSLYGGSGWTYDKATRQYYFHTFFRQQPDLNWRNPELRSYFFSVMRFWLDLGIDGFRLDAINVLVKDPEFRDAQPSLLAQLLGKENYVTRNQPETYQIILELREVADEYKGIMLVGEIYTLPPGNHRLVASYLTNTVNLLHLAFNFSLIFSRWSAKRFSSIIGKWMDSIPVEAWPCNVLSNHDLNRSIGSDWLKSSSDDKAKVMATLLLTLKGTPFIYYGEEIAMRNAWIPKRKIKDPLGKRFWPIYQGRDCSRTPMRWNNSKNEGFSTGEPWLPVYSDNTERNVLNQMNYNNSILLFYHKLLALRKSSLCLLYGEWNACIIDGKNVLAYYRYTLEEKILIILNFSNRQRHIHLKDELDGCILISTHRRADEQIKATFIVLFPYESTVILIRTND